MLEWTREKLDRRDAGDIGGSFEPYRELLAALDRYAKAAPRDPDDQALAALLRVIIGHARNQLERHPAEARNLAVRAVHDAAQAELERLLRTAVERAAQRLSAAPGYHAAESVLFATDDYRREFDGHAHAGQVAARRQEALNYKFETFQYVNTASTGEHNVSADRHYLTRTRMVVPAKVNCALCTAAGVATSLTGRLVSTDALVRHLYPNPDEVLSGDADRALVADGLDYAKVYQHPESFNRIGRTLTGGMADVSSTSLVNSQAAEGMRRALQRLGVPALGERSATMTAAEAKRVMTQSEYEGCVFAVLLVSAGHWNAARRTASGLRFIDYQTDHVGWDGARSGPNPQKGMDPAPARRDLGDEETVSFTAFRC
ncbi:hypothetical protein ABT095_36530 [Kitasatospora sp. NPDC002227]|uniref:hypothetical protein n=1 Tax=Kitasatospora sp. NPDC002227 TaxID=3154773 RepID=UPI00331E9402